jgi:hypothetical protein
MKYYVSLVFLFLTSNASFAQRGRFITNSTVSGAVGTTTYYGDLSPYRYPLKGLLLSSSFNSSLHYTREVNERRAHNVAIHFSELRGSDFRYNQNTKIFFASNYIRGLHFRNRSLQIDFSEKIYLIENQSTIYRKRNKFLPYLTLGLGLLHNNPSARESFSDTKGDWVRLRPLNTQGTDKKYPAILAYLPVGLGFNIKINRRMDFMAQGRVNVCFSDVLDDVTQTPYLTAESFSNPKAYEFHKRIYEPIDALTGAERTSDEWSNRNFEEPAFRGNNSSIFTKYDLFITTEFGVTYWLDWKIR